MNEHQTLITRVEHPKPAFRLLEEMWVERGTREDWLLLQHLHYKMHSEPVGAKYWRLRFRGETIGVMVLGMSRPLLKERHAVFPMLCPGIDTQVSNIHRYAHINDHFRVVGRFVVDTMFRSAGVAYRFLNLAARMTGFRFVEIQSSMSKYNEFAQRGGFSMVRPIRSIHYEKGLKFMRRWFAAHPADQEALMEEYATMAPALQARVEKELKAFYFDNSPLEKTGSRRHYSAGVVENWDVRRTISKIQGLCFASPLYGYYRNPNCAGEADAKGSNTTTHLPEVLPLLAFDLQLPSQALRTDMLDVVPGWVGLREQIEAHDWRRVTSLAQVGGTGAGEDQGDENTGGRKQVAKPKARKGDKAPIDQGSKAPKGKNHKPNGGRKPKDHLSLTNKSALTITPPESEFKGQNDADD